jgi:hypothetical protein
VGEGEGGGFYRARILRKNQSKPSEPYGGSPPCDDTAS